MNLKNRLRRLERGKRELPPLVIASDLSMEEIQRIQRESQEKYGMPSLIIILKSDKETAVNERKQSTSLAPFPPTTSRTA